MQSLKLGIDTLNQDIPRPDRLVPLTPARFRTERSPAIFEARPVSTSHHGTSLLDEYAWLRAENWQEVLKNGKALPDPIRRHLEAENKYSTHVLKDTAKLQKQLLAELRGRIKEADSSPPAPDGPYAYFTQYDEGAEHPLICRQARGGGELEILLNCAKMARGKAFFDLGDSVHSPDHKLVAWSVDLEGSEFYTIRIRNPLTGRDRRDRIAMTSGSIVWAANAQAFYYVEIDANHRPRFVKRHKLGTDLREDVAIYEEKSDLYFIEISETQSGAYGIINISGHESSEEWLFDLADPNATARLVAKRDENTLYDCDHHGRRLLIRTNADGAEDFKIVRAPLDQPQRANWQDFIPYRAGVMILSTLVLKDYLIRLEREGGSPRIVIHRFADANEYQISFTEEAFDLELASGFEFDTVKFRFSYSSMTTPNEIYEYDLASQTRTLIKQLIIPSGHDPAHYITRRLYAKASDGREVPISILHRRDQKLDGSAPCLLYAYGSYGYAMTAAFDSDPLSLVDRGFIYAIAHVRGGTDKGWNWYQDGKRDKKRNTFSDFLAVARHLCSQNYTRPGQIVAQGGSAGGMLMGAIANMSPELFAGLIAEVPFVDVLNTILDADLPLTPPEWLEWGNPIEDKAAFDYIHSYSPYENVKAQAYPAILATAGLSDPRVTYWEPAKWVARLRARMTGGGPILLRTNMDAGHSGASGRFEHLGEVALAYAFAIAAVQSAPLQ